LILMLLIYFNSLVLLIGFELNVSISSLKRIAEERTNISAEGDGQPQ
jgi:membrane protein